MKNVTKIADHIIEETSMKLSCAPNVNVCGCEIEIENYKKIYKLTNNEIILLFSRKRDDLKIVGNNLRVKKVSESILTIAGEISEIIYLNRKDIKKCIKDF